MFDSLLAESPEAGRPGGTLVAADDVLDPVPDGAPDVTVGELADRHPGADLAWLLEVTDAHALDDHDVVELVAAWQRMSAWATAGAARAAAALADRASMSPAWPASAGRVSEPNVAGEELAMRLGCSRRQGRALVRQGRAFGGALAWTGDALASGQIDATKARLLVEALDEVPVPVALEVQHVVLPAAPTRTPTQLARDIARALIRVDPDGAGERHRIAARGRRVDAPRVLPDGMAGLWAVLPATGAMRLDSALSAQARAARTSGDPRTLDQLRADLLVDLTTGTVEGCAAAAALAAVDGPEATQGTAEARVDGEPNDTGPNDTGPNDTGRAPTRRPAPRTQIRVTVALSTLLGLDDCPADLTGYGPITAEAALALARDGTWRRIVTDPLSGAVLDVGRTRYRPPVDLDDHVRIRDRACARPGCPTHAEGCDLDHTVDFHRDEGPTAHTNLGPLCRRDHVIKTHGGHRLAQTAPGEFEWTTPTGHRYRTHPGLDLPYERLPRGEPPPF